jgi:UPF0716 family protein affecting phage T7 exclusion
MPLQLFGLQGRFLVYAASIIAIVLMGFLIMFSLIGAGMAIIVTLVNAVVGAVFFFKQKKKGLHNKKRNNFINVYQGICVNH